MSNDDWWVNRGSKRYWSKRGVETGEFLRNPENLPENTQLDIFSDVLGTRAAGTREAVSEVFRFPESSRCAAARYHFKDRKLLMTWTNGKTPWIYDDVPKDTFDRFVTSGSKGKYVNTILTSGFSHRKLYPGQPYSEYVYGDME